MRKSRILALAILAASIADRAVAADKCSVKGKMQDQSFQLQSCAVAFYPDRNSVTIWFTEKPLSASAVETFQRGSYADVKGTGMSFAFCPGGGKPTADPKTVNYVDVAISHASSPMLQQNWLFKPGGNTGLKTEKMSGELKAGGKLSGRFTGKTKTEQGQVYTWEADFDVALPTLTAAAGIVCD
jgi:hypothetical protein